MMLKTNGSSAMFIRSQRRPPFKCLFLSLIWVKTVILTVMLPSKLPESKGKSIARKESNTKVNRSRLQDSKWHLQEVEEKWNAVLPWTTGSSVVTWVGDRKPGNQVPKQKVDTRQTDKMTNVLWEYMVIVVVVVLGMNRRVFSATNNTIGGSLLQVVVHQDVDCKSLMMTMMSHTLVWWWLLVISFKKKNHEHRKDVVDEDDDFVLESDVLSSKSLKSLAGHRGMPSRFPCNEDQPLLLNEYFSKIERGDWRRNFCLPQVLNAQQLLKLLSNSIQTPCRKKSSWEFLAVLLGCSRLFLRLPFPHFETENFAGWLATRVLSLPSSSSSSLPRVFSSLFERRLTIRRFWKKATTTIKSLIKRVLQYSFFEYFFVCLLKSVEKFKLKRWEEVTRIRLKIIVMPMMTIRQKERSFLLNKLGSETKKIRASILFALNSKTSYTRKFLFSLS